ncbi:MAG: TetR/AcrR family transcriptional regulator [Streptosporangiaceae bacterium]|nr:TetR/AcrR family transcriptional regulator [Streptosporangiaceae bacterium]
MPATRPAPDGARDRPPGSPVPALRALQPAQPEDPQERASRKRRQIRQAAAGEFLSKGYAGTSMDDVAAAARVSKQTVYKHFGSKEELFVAIIEATVGEVMDEVFERVGPTPGRHGELAQELLTMGRRLIVLIMQPELLALRRLVTGEASRFPQLGEVWWRGGPARLMAGLAELLRQAGQDGELAINDPQLAAQQLQWLILSIPLNRAMLCPGQAYTSEELYHYSDAGIRTFLAAYRPATPAADDAGTGRR